MQKYQNKRPDTIHHSDLTDCPKVVPEDKWYAPPAKPPDDPEKKSGVNPIRTPWKGVILIY
jgi:hypothetical protein